MYRTKWFCVMFLAMGYARSALAQAPGEPGQIPSTIQPQPVVLPAAVEARPDLVTRTYEISDLVRPTRNYPLGGGAGVAMAPGMDPMSGTPNGFAGAAGPMGVPVPGDERAVISVDELVKLITDTVDPGTWRDAGGGLGTIRGLNGMLVVSQTHDAQKRIEDLLKTLRSEQGPAAMLSVRAYWVLLEPQEIRDAFIPNRKDVDNAKAAAAAGRTVTRAMPTIDEKLLDKSHLYCQGQTICFSGQTVHVTSGREWSAVTGVSPVVAANAVGYDPRTTRVQSGVSLQVTPQLVPNTDAAILDLRSIVTETRAPASAIDLARMPSTQSTPADVRNAATGLIDRIDVANQQLATTVRLPTGIPVLLGGMTLSPATPDQQARQLYLVVQVDVVR
jgi:type II secretory pathway component GspD/PulD (secretin)